MDYSHYTPFIPDQIYYSTFISYTDGAFSIYVQPSQNMSSDHHLPIPMSPGIGDVDLQYESPDHWTNLLYQTPNLGQQSEIFNANEDDLDPRKMVWRMNVRGLIGRLSQLSTRTLPVPLPHLGVSATTIKFLDQGNFDARVLLAHASVVGFVDAVSWTCTDT
jgi:hypothetical protein